VIYYPGMMRSLAVVAVALTFAATTGVANAEPSPPKACSYVLSPPHVVQLSGTNVVTATLSAAGCDQSTVTQTVACVQLQGSDGHEQCDQGEGIIPAQIYYQPYRAGATYVATGRGCAVKGNPPQPICATTGPLTATL
jgi:hypothetical protein